MNSVRRSPKSSDKIRPSVPPASEPLASTPETEDAISTEKSEDLRSLPGPNRPLNKEVLEDDSPDTYEQPPSEQQSSATSGRDGQDNDAVVDKKVHRDNEEGTKTYSMGDAEVAQLHALTRETYTMSLRELRQERQAWRVDKLELEHLRKVVYKETPIDEKIQLQAMLKEKAAYEEQMDSYHEEIRYLKENLHTLQTEQKDLKAELAQSHHTLEEERSRHLSSQNGTFRDSHEDARRIKDLEEQLNKWEVLFFESAEVGERRIERLEEELENTKEELARTKYPVTLTPSCDEPSTLKTIGTKRDADQDEDLRLKIRELERILLEKDAALEMQTETSHKDVPVTSDSSETMSVYASDEDESIPEAKPDLVAERILILSQEMTRRELSLKKQHALELEEREAKIVSLTKILGEAGANGYATRDSEITLNGGNEGPGLGSRDMAKMMSDTADGDSHSESSSQAAKENVEQYITSLEKQLVTQEMEIQRLREELVLANRSAKDAKASNSAHGMAVLQKKLDEVQKELQSSKTGESELREKIEIMCKAKTLNFQGDSAEAKEPQYVELKSELQEVSRQLEAARRENAQLRLVKDSLMGIDHEMEELIEALEPLQAELDDQTKRADGAYEEAAAFKQQLNRETLKLQERERQIKALEAEIQDTREKLDRFYIELKEEQAQRFNEKEMAQKQIANLKEDLESHQNNLEMLHAALGEANEELRKHRDHYTDEMTCK